MFVVMKVIVIEMMIWPSFWIGIGHFTVVCLVTWPLSRSEAGGDLVLIQTLLLFICKCKLVSMRTT